MSTIEITSNNEVLHDMFIEASAEKELQETITNGIVEDLSSFEM